MSTREVEPRAPQVGVPDESPWTLGGQLPQGVLDAGLLSVMANELLRQLSPGLPGAAPVAPDLAAPELPTSSATSSTILPYQQAPTLSRPSFAHEPTSLPAAPGSGGGLYILEHLGGAGQNPVSGSDLFSRGHGAPGTDFALPWALPDAPAHDLNGEPRHVSQVESGSTPYFLQTPPVAPGLSASEPRPVVPAQPVHAHEQRAPERRPDALSTHAQAPVHGAGLRQFDAATFRRDFPILKERVNGKPLVWLDNAATTQKPQSVIDRISYFYEHENSNIHRAAHTLAARATDAYEAARDKVRRFVNAPSAQDIVFTRGTTEAINLVAQSFGRRNLRAGDEVLITWLEHHSNIVPWQLLCKETGAVLRVAPIDDRGQVRLDEYERLLGPRTKLVSFTQVSNALGTVTPAQEMVAMAHRHGARVLVDGAQAVSHMRVDVQALDCDFYVFSGHKVFGPTGIGALYGKSELLEAMPPWQGGGNMIADVTFEKTVFHGAPARFEAGTGNIADAVGLGAALDYVERIGMDNIARYEHELLEYGTECLLQVPRLRLVGTAQEKAGVLSFVIADLPSEQIGAALAQEGIAVRSGHHCAQPALRRYGLENTVRPSLALYNTRDDIDALVSVLKRLESGRLV